MVRTLVSLSTGQLVYLLTGQLINLSTRQLVILSTRQLPNTIHDHKTHSTFNKRAPYILPCYGVRILFPRRGLLSRRGSCLMSCLRVRGNRMGAEGRHAIRGVYWRCIARPRRAQAHRILRFKQPRWAKTTTHL